MQNRTDIIVIGSGPAGMISAITAKKFYPEKSVLVLKSIENGCVPCGIPYMLSSLQDPTTNKSGGQAVFKKYDIETNTEKVIKINRTQKTINTTSGNVYNYDKLILATGSTPIIPKIAGFEKSGVYAIYKDMQYLLPMVEEIKKSKSVLIIGGGFIGVEFADEISKIAGIKVYLVELLPQILINSFDKEFAELAAEKLTKQGVELITGVKVEKILGTHKVQSALLSDGRTIEVDSVILGMGSIPNSKLAADTNLEIDNSSKGICVDEHMRTSDPDIFAVGDCANKKDSFTNRNTSVMLASTATTEARIAGANLYQLKMIRENQDTIAIYSTYVNGLVLGSAGITQRRGQEEQNDLVIGLSRSPDKHPATMPGATHTTVKLIFSRKTGILLGGQIAGGTASSELINMIGVAIQKKMTARELACLQIATHPYLTSSPTAYPVITAAQNVLKEM